ncbi:PepSY domain-containing protein [Sphingomonas sp. NBWT7]|uniref:PepSY-associated TM helix domain-containing protein n=1 Tax=Sphingomonas sp. NBWT7 TaxID=2596913 RepID=UPI001628F7D8|nr:PepSY domain-containing protein [Sphingomonas sp. NBWT7]QNE32845.1 PepSY domain-containing protein [Sphingomonas sp. NBWT7]
MSRGVIRGWFLVHKWSSLVSTVFLLMLCVTGLPLIFHDEIDALAERGGRTVSATPSSGVSPALQSLDAILARALAAKPGDVPLFMAFSNDDATTTVTTGARPDVPAEAMTLHLFDRVTGQPIGATPAEGEGVMAFLLRLHTDMLMGLPGMFFLGAMGALFVVALASGAVLYAPFMRKLDFGTLRTRRSRRVAWLDHHNLLGIVALAWMAVVGLTGIVNAFVTPITKMWQAGELAEMTQAYAGRAALPPARYGSLDRAMAAARRAVPGMNSQFIAFPGGAFSSRHHYAIFFQGATPLTERLLTTALVDAKTGQLTDQRPMPWYFRALMLSRPLHFGDYGGLPMKLLWALLDVFTIVVLGSGVYLWLGRRRAPTDVLVREIARGARPFAGVAAMPAE